jgi:hypothetical protein
MKSSFLVDVDNTLLDNDHIQADIKSHLEREYGVACRVERSGLSEAVDSHVLIYIHKELVLDYVEARYPSRRYVLVDDKPHILAAVKEAWGNRVTNCISSARTIRARFEGSRFVCRARFAVDRIGDLLDIDLGSLLAGCPQGSPSDRSTK